MIADLNYLFYWWLSLFIIGLIFLPLTSFIFGKFSDRGYIFSKIIGISIVSYIVFILGVSQILPFSRNNSILVIAVSLAINVLILLKQKKRIIYKNWKFFLFEELLFIAGLIFLSRIRASQPDIHGLEKFMDFGFINSILRAEYFPPKDMWFTPFSINYYYFGHLVTAVLTKISGISSNITFNLMLAAVFSLTFVASFSIGVNFIQPLAKNRKVRIFSSGLLTAFLITFSGNLHTIYSLFKNYNVDNPAPFWQLPFAPFSIPNGYWYPNATRFIYNTIHEFPMYSWVVSDLHGHVLDIPIVLLVIALFLSIFKNGQTSKDILYFIFSGFFLAIAYMTNAWDGLIYFIFAFTLIIYFLLKTKKYKLGFGKLTALIFSFLIFTAPFNRFFKPFVSGIGVLCSPESLVSLGRIGPFLFEPNHCQVSPLWQLAILYGFFYFFVISFILFLLKRKINNLDIFAIFLIILSTSLIILPELIYAKDIYPAHYRANTMFKLVYQSFIMLSLSSSYIFFRIATEFRKRWDARLIAMKLIWSFSFLVLFSFVAIYPYFSISSYYNGLKTYYGLNGTSYLKNLYPEDYHAINWLNKNIKGQPVILEAQGDSYTDFARISANTGLPTVLGWTVHEWLWRGTYDVPAPRISDIKNLYENEDVNITKKLLNKYKVSLVYVGNLENKKYQLKDQKFNKLGKIIYKKGDTKIYKIN